MADIFRGIFTIFVIFGFWGRFIRCELMSFRGIICARLIIGGRARGHPRAERPARPGQPPGRRLGRRGRPQHTRRYPLALTSYDEQLTAVPGIGVEMHTGPVSPTTILANQAQQAGLGRSLTLRVGIPGYLSAEAQNPRAVVDMIKALEKILGITVDSEEYTELQAKADS